VALEKAANLPNCILMCTGVKGKDIIEANINKPLYFSYIHYEFIDVV